MKYLIIFCFGITSLQLGAQELMFSKGTNYTDFDYSNNEDPTNLNLQRGQGNYYELIYIKDFGTAEWINYHVGLVLNEWNATGGNQLNNYSWNTGYLGVKTGLSVLISSAASGLTSHLNMGVTGSRILNGRQAVNGFTYDLKDQEDFGGYFLGLYAGLGVSFPITDKFSLGVGYQYGKHTKLENMPEESLGFINHQLRFNLILKLNQNDTESTDSTSSSK
jgi:hypothetical protein